jgi:hypothetical protein
MYNKKPRKKHMKIKQWIVDKINNPMARTRLALALEIGEATVAVHIRGNADNGRLTKMDALKAISAETGVDVGEILEVSEEKESVQK